MNGSNCQHQPLNHDCPERPLHPKNRPHHCADRSVPAWTTAPACWDIPMSTR